MKMLKNEQSIRRHSKDFQAINQLSRLLTNYKYGYQLNGNSPSCFIIQGTSKYRHFKFSLWHDYFPFRNNNGQRTNGKILSHRSELLILPKQF